MMEIIRDKNGNPIGMKQTMIKIEGVDGNEGFPQQLIQQLMGMGLPGVGMVKREIIDPEMEESKINVPNSNIERALNHLYTMPILEDKNRISLVIPGMKKEDIKIERKGASIKVSFKNIVKEFKIPTLGKMDIKYEDGVLSFNFSENKEVLMIE